MYYFWKYFECATDQSTVHTISSNTWWTLQWKVATRPTSGCATASSLFILTYYIPWMTARPAYSTYCTCKVCEVLSTRLWRWLGIHIYVPTSMNPLGQVLVLEVQATAVTGRTIPCSINDIWGRETGKNKIYRAFMWKDNSIPHSSFVMKTKMIQIYATVSINCNFLWISM